jgi:hypothetical protein
VLFDLDGSTLQPIQTDVAAGTATLTGTTVRLSSTAATALNQAFGTDAVQGGLTIGVATIVVDLPGQMPAMPQGGVETGGGATSDPEPVRPVGEREPCAGRTAPSARVPVAWTGAVGDTAPTTAGVKR